MGKKRTALAGRPGMEAETSLPAGAVDRRTHRVPLSHPLGVQFTPDQMAWLDRQRVGGLTRSAVIRLVVEEAMRREEQGKK